MNRNELIKKMAGAMQVENRPREDFRNADQRDADESATRPAYRSLAETALNAIEAAGVALVPVDVTEQQLDAASEAMRKPRLRLNYQKADDIQTLAVAYCAMLASSPYRRDSDDK